MSVWHVGGLEALLCGEAPKLVNLHPDPALKARVMGLPVTVRITLQKTNMEPEKGLFIDNCPLSRGPVQVPR